MRTNDPEGRGRVPTNTLKTYSVLLVTKGFYGGSVQATSTDEAIARTFEIWRNEEPHPFEKDDEELVTVTAEEEE
jgi:hypothetical protein